MPGPATEAEHRLLRVAEGLSSKVARALGDFRIHDASAAVWALVDEANRYVDENAPWHLAKLPSSEARQRLECVLYNLLESLRIIALHLSPFLPGASARLLQQIGLPAQTGATASAWGALVAGTKLPGGAILFPKIE